MELASEIAVKMTLNTYFFRHVRSLHGSMGNVGSSISAQPLLPVTDNDIGEYGLPHFHMSWFK